MNRHHAHCACSAEWKTSLPWYSWLARLLSRFKHKDECIPYLSLGVKAVININRLWAREDCADCVPDPDPTDRLFDRAGGPGKTARAVGGYTELVNCGDFEDGTPDDIPSDLSDASDLSDQLEDNVPTPSDPDAPEDIVVIPSPSPSPFPPEPIAPPPSPQPPPSPAPSPPLSFCTHFSSLSIHEGSTEEVIQVQLDYGAHFSAQGSGALELRVTLWVDDASNSGTEDIQGVAVKDLLQPPPTGLIVTSIILDPPISSAEYPDFLIDYGNVSGHWHMCLSSASRIRLVQISVCHIDDQALIALLWIASSRCAPSSVLMSMQRNRVTRLGLQVLVL